ncbi:MAG: DUF998 domain-containing protein [Thermoproteota archaeon]
MLVWVLGAVIAYPFIFLSALLSPWFNIYDNALSDLGNTCLNVSVAWIFNGGLVLSGALIAFFSIMLSIKKPFLKYLGGSVPLFSPGWTWLSSGFSQKMLVVFTHLYQWRFSRCS